MSAEPGFKSGLILKSILQITVLLSHLENFVLGVDVRTQDVRRGTRQTELELHSTLKHTLGSGGG